MGYGQSSLLTKRAAFNKAWIGSGDSPCTEANVARFASRQTIWPRGGRNSQAYHLCRNWIFIPCHPQPGMLRCTRTTSSRKIEPLPLAWSIAINVVLRTLFLRVFLPLREKIMATWVLSHRARSYISVQDKVTDLCVGAQLSFLHHSLRPTLVYNHVKGV